MPMEPVHVGDGKPCCSSNTISEAQTHIRLLNASKMSSLPLDHRKELLFVLEGDTAYSLAIY